MKCLHEHTCRCFAVFLKKTAYAILYKLQNAVELLSTNIQSDDAAFLSNHHTVSMKFPHYPVL